MRHLLIYARGVDDRTRQNLGYLLVCIAVAVVALVLPEDFRGLVWLIAGIIGVVALANIGLDLMKPRR